MKPGRTVKATACLGLIAAAGLAAAAQAASPARLLRAAAERPAPAGHERAYLRWLQSQLPKLPAAADNLHDLYYRLGPASVRPLLLVTEVDEPDYVVSRITRRGYLRLAALRGAAAFPLSAAKLFFSSPVTILRRRGPLTGVGLAPSIHLMSRRRFLSLDRRLNLRHVYIATGAADAAADRRAGIHLLDPVVIEPQLFAAPRSPDWLGSLLASRVMTPVLGRLLRWFQAHPPARPLAVAFATQGYFDHGGLRRLLHELHPAQVIFLGSTGVGELTAQANPAARALGQRWAADTGMEVRFGISPRADHGVSAASGKTPMLVLDFPVAYRHTAAELINLNTLHLFSHALTGFVAARTGTEAAYPEKLGPGWALNQAVAWPPKHAPGRLPLRTARFPEPATVAPVLARLVQVAAVSRHEAPMRRAIRKILRQVLPQPIPLHQGPDGDLWLRLGPASGRATLFIAHMDEIGWTVTGILPDGELALQPQGGFLRQLYAGRILLVHTARGDVPGALHYIASGLPGRPPLARLDVGLSGAGLRHSGIRLGDPVTVPKRWHPLLGDEVAGRALDDRVGDTALIAALRELAAGPRLRHPVIFCFSAGEEIGLDGARALAGQLHPAPRSVYALDTFVSSNSPLESRRYADARLGRGFVIRAADNSLIASRRWVREIEALARREHIPVQAGVTGGGNDASAFIPDGSRGIDLGWPILSSHSPGEISDLRDVAALARITVAIAENPPH